jgi:radical SAM superfamily enzyme YgiQ (UPF0313 family)
MYKNPFNILLINPWIYDFAAYDLWAKPLGFLYLASLLREQGFTIHYIDCLNPDQRSFPELTRKRKETGKAKFYKTKIKKPDPLTSIPKDYNRYGIPLEVFHDMLKRLPPPNVIMITSTMTYWYPGVFEVINQVKKIYPEASVILGGIYATLCPEHAKTNSGADRVISGGNEYEILTDIFSFIGKNNAFPLTPNLLDSLPYPSFDIYRKVPYVCIATSRGCPYHCLYCASHRLHDSFIYRDPIAVVDEIEFWWKQHGVTNFAFYDDALLFDSENRIVPIMKEIIRRKIPVHFHTPNGMHLRGMTEEIARLMFLSGFKTLRFGLETTDENLMKKTGGKTTRDEFICAIKHLKKAGYSNDELGMYLLAGLPGQCAEDVEKSIAFVKYMGARPYLTEFSPIPKTSLWEEAIKNSRFDLANEPLFHNNSIFPCEWEGFTRSDLERLKRFTRQKK